eukprot:Rmarinus@m.19180
MSDTTSQDPKPDSGLTVMVDSVSTIGNGLASNNPSTESRLGHIVKMSGTLLEISQVLKPTSLRMSSGGSDVEVSSFLEELASALQSTATELQGDFFKLQAAVRNPSSPRATFSIPSPTLSGTKFVDSISQIKQYREEQPPEVLDYSSDSSEYSSSPSSPRSSHPASTHPSTLPSSANTSIGTPVVPIDAPSSTDSKLIVATMEPPKRANQGVQVNMPQSPSFGPVSPNHSDESNPPSPGVQRRPVRSTVGPGTCSACRAKRKDVLVYARHLGLDPSRDSALLWLAEEAMSAPVVDGWTEQVDEQGNVYYYHPVTDSSSWDHPLDSYYRGVVMTFRRARDEAMAGIRTASGNIIADVSPQALRKAARYGMDMAAGVMLTHSRLRRELASRMHVNRPSYINFHYSIPPGGPSNVPVSPVTSASASVMSSAHTSAHASSGSNAAVVPGSTSSTGSDRKNGGGGGGAVLSEATQQQVLRALGPLDRNSSGSAGQRQRRSDDSHSNDSSGRGRGGRGRVVLDPLGEGDAGSQTPPQRHRSGSNSASASLGGDSATGITLPRTATPSAGVKRPQSLDNSLLAPPLTLSPSQDSQSPSSAKPQAASNAHLNVRNLRPVPRRRTDLDPSDVAASRKPVAPSSLPAGALLAVPGSRSIGGSNLSGSNSNSNSNGSKSNNSGGSGSGGADSAAGVHPQHDGSHSPSGGGVAPVSSTDSLHSGLSNTSVSQGSTGAGGGLGGGGFGGLGRMSDSVDAGYLRPVSPKDQLSPSSDDSGHHPPW